ncbi:hypothetical protein [Treponema sp. UBA7570]|uniref:hypothetical protein n=1 Tax=Treponema sp. UBA7570 TaxID=1947749 RepID=UPI0025E2E3A4|nr:hypothetical protein [Treponema sp. UBA7570]
MKALLVADNQIAIDNISQVLETAGYDVIIYKWLLKALDNVEEIAPHLIIVSTKDYPRHWKTLTQYAQTVCTSYKPQVILYSEGGLEDEEAQKAKALNVRGIFDSVDVKGLDEFRKILTKETDIYSGKLLSDDGIPTVGNLLTNSENDEKTETENSIQNTQNKQNCEKEEIDELLKNAAEILNSQETEIVQPNKSSSIEKTENSSDNENSLLEIKENATPSDFSDIVKSGEKIKSIACTFMFENPVSGKLITGYACNFDGKTFEFNADIPDFVKNLYNGIEIENCSLKTKESTKNVHTIVKQNEENMILELR